MFKQKQKQTRCSIESWLVLSNQHFPHYFSRQTRLGSIFEIERDYFVENTIYKLYKMAALENNVHKKKLYGCDICGFRSSLKTNLKQHILSVHEGMRRYKCELCDYKCHKKYNLDQHIASVHDKNKNFQCENCDYSSSNKATVKKTFRISSW